MKIKHIIGYIFLGYFAIDTYVGHILWNIKEGLVGYQILWFQIPLTNIIYYKQNIEWLSTLPGFSMSRVYHGFLNGIFLAFCSLCVAIWVYMQSPLRTEDSD